MWNASSERVREHSEHKRRHNENCADLIHYKLYEIATITFKTCKLTKTSGIEAFKLVCIADFIQQNKTFAAFLTVFRQFCISEHNCA